MIVGSAGFIPGQLSEYDVDLLFLGIGGLGSQTAQYRQQYWRHTVETVTPERLIFIHWDSLTAPLDGPLVGEVRLAQLLTNGNAGLLDSLQARERADATVSFQTLPLFAEIPLVAPTQ